MNHTDFQPAGPAPVPERKTGGEMLTRSVLAYIEAHYRDKFSLQAMAGELYVNGSYLLRVFKRNTGYTPLAWHNHVRCEKARELLTRTGKSVSEIGEAVGFVSSAHFTHVFKKEAGCTPSEYRFRQQAAPSVTAGHHHE